MRCSCRHRFQFNQPRRNRCAGRNPGLHHAGLEYYGEYGPIHHPLPHNERAHYLYGVMDIEKKDWDINLGIGRGFVNAGDTWVAKAIIAFPFK